MALAPIIESPAIGTGTHTKPAANTAGKDLKNYPLFTLIGGPYRADFYTGRPITMHTGKWGKTYARISLLPFFLEG